MRALCSTGGQYSKKLYVGFVAASLVFFPQERGGLQGKILE